MQRNNNDKGADRNSQATHCLERQAEWECVRTHKNLLVTYCWRCCNNNERKQASARTIGLQNRIDGSGSSSSSGSNAEIVYLKYFNRSVI